MDVRGAIILRDRLAGRTPPEAGAPPAPPPEDALPLAAWTTHRQPHVPPQAPLTDEVDAET